MSAERRGIDAEKLTNFTAKVFQKLDVPEEDAQITARILVETDLRGVETHGIAHLKPFYFRRIRLGIINVKPKPQIFSQTPSTATIDGDQGLGFVIGHRAMLEAIHRAEKTGAGFVAVRNSTHFGASAYYAMMALPHDMIGISLTSTIPGVVPPGSSARGVGTNPIAVAVPSGKRAPFVLDMATSVVAGGKIEIARRKGDSIPVGWAVDKTGKPITDPTKMSRDNGGLLPLGGTPQLGAYKGFGLGVLVEILCSILSGATARLLVKVEPGAEGNACDHFFGALRIDSFTPIDKFKKSMDDMIEAFEALPTLPGVDKIYVAGELESRLKKERQTNGIPLHPTVIQELKDLAEELGIKYDL